MNGLIWKFAFTLVLIFLFQFLKIFNFLEQILSSLSMTKLKYPTALLFK